MKKIFIYSSSNGQSLKICKALNKNKESLIIDMDMLKTSKLDNFDQIVIGASVKYGDHNKKVYEFVKKNRVLLEKKRQCFFLLMLLRESLKKTHLKQIHIS